MATGFGSGLAPLAPGTAGTLVGIPLYSNAAGVIPIVSALMEKGASLGTVLGLEDGGGSGLLSMEGGWYVPFVRSICVEIDPARKRIVVDLPEGLKVLNRP